jgi:hypothetical protein
MVRGDHQRTQTPATDSTSCLMSQAAEPIGGGYLFILRSFILI